MKKVLFLTLFLVSSLALAQAVTSTTVAPPLPLAPTVQAVANATSSIPSSLPAGVIMLLTFVISEMAAHGIPTQKPISWFLGISALLTGVILMLQKVQALCNILGNSLQNTSSPPTA